MFHFQDVVSFTPPWPLNRSVLATLAIGIVAPPRSGLIRSSWISQSSQLSAVAMILPQIWWNPIFARFKGGSRLDKIVCLKRGVAGDGVVKSESKT